MYAQATQLHSSRQKFEASQMRTWGQASSKSQQFPKWRAVRSGEPPGGGQANRRDFIGSSASSLLLPLLHLTSGELQVAELPSKADRWTQTIASRTCANKKEKLVEPLERANCGSVAKSDLAPDH